MAKTVWQIWEETQALLAEFEEWRRRIHEETQALLAEFKEWRRHIHQEGIERWEDVQEMLSRFREERKKAHDESVEKRIKGLEEFLKKIRQQYMDDIHGHPTEPVRSGSNRSGATAAAA